MTYLILLLIGTWVGLVVSIVFLNKMMRQPTSRIWLSDWANWSNNEIPEGAFQLVRHGKWIATKDDELQP